MPTEFALVVFGLLSLPGDEPFLAKLEWKDRGTGCTERFGHFATWDEKRAALLVGYGAKRSGEQFDMLDDVWSFGAESGSWTKIEIQGAKPVRRSYAAATFDSKQGVVWLFGGMGEDFAGMADLWKLDPAARTWTRVKPEGVEPGPRLKASLHFDPRANRLVLFGGCRQFFGDDNAWDDLWTFDVEHGKWSTRAAPEHGRCQAATAVVPDLNVLVVHGGYDGNGTLRAETSLCDLATGKWTDLGKAPIKPSAAFASAWDAAAGQLLVHAGATNASKGLEELWAFHPKTKKWKKLAGGTPGPGPRGYHAGALDPVGKTLYVFGGTKSSFGDPLQPAGLWSMKLHP